jgi:signal transduction histidine kinase
VSSALGPIRIRLKSRCCIGRRDLGSMRVHPEVDVATVRARYGLHMRPLLRDRRVLDGALAAVLAVWAVLEVTTGDPVGSTPVTAAAGLLVALAVTFRRRFPIGSLVFAMATGIAQALADGSLTQTAAPAVAFLILAYSASAYRTGRAAALGLLLAVAGIEAATLIESETGTYGHTAGDYLFNMLWPTAAWLVGFALRGRALRIAGLENETARLAREREERARAAVAEERARIARDLHDVVAHNVSVMVVQATAAEEVLAREPERARAPLLAIQETGTQALNEMRRLLGILRADDRELTLGRQPGLASLNALVGEFRDAGLPVEVSVEGEGRQLPPGVDLAAYRIVEEALTNALKHAGGAATRVSIRHADGTVELEVADDGPGPVGGDGGHGLIGMRERAAMYGGTLEAGARVGRGFAVRARLPLASDGATTRGHA